MPKTNDLACACDNNVLLLFSLGDHEGHSHESCDRPKKTTDRGETPQLFHNFSSNNPLAFAAVTARRQQSIRLPMAHQNTAFPHHGVCASSQRLHVFVF